MNAQHHHGHASSYANTNLHLLHPVPVEVHDKHGHHHVDYYVKYSIICFNNKQEIYLN